MDGTTKILMVTAGQLSVGGVEKHLLSLADGLKDSYSFSLLGDLIEPFSSQWKELGGGLYSYSPRGSFDLAAAREIRRVIKRDQPDVIHIHDSPVRLVVQVAGLADGGHLFLLAALALFAVASGWRRGCLHLPGFTAAALGVAGRLLVPGFTGSVFAAC